MRPTRRGRPRGGPGRADARRPRPDRFEHGEFAYAQTSRWPHFDQKLSLTTAMITRSRASYVLSLIHISEPTRQAEISYAVFCLKKKKKIKNKKKKKKKKKKDKKHKTQKKKKN